MRFRQENDGIGRRRTIPKAIPSQDRDGFQPSEF
jgi:hypothetical protein